MAEEVTDEGKWFKLTKDEVTLEAGKNEIVPFTVSIPKDVAVGEHNACIVIQEKKTDDSDSGVNLSFRTAIRAMITIPGDIVRDLSIKNFVYTKTDNGKNTLNLVLSNKGNVSLDTNIKIEVKDFITSKVFFSNDSTYPILHSNDQDFNYDLDNNPWGGVYKATANVTYDGNTEKKTVSESITFVILPSVYAAALYLVSLIVVVTAVLLIVINKKKTLKVIRESVEYIVKPGDTLVSIGKENSIKWKLLAKINNLKAPFTINAGDRILVPSSKKTEPVPTQEEILPTQPVVTPSVTQPVLDTSAAITPAATPIEPTVQPVVPSTPTTNNENVNQNGFPTTPVV